MPVDRNKEIENLKTVGEYHGHTETEGGHHIVLATKKPGTHITNTNAWKNAGTEEEKKAVLAKAQQLTDERNTHHANTHGLVHTCVRYFSTHRHISLLTLAILTTAMSSSTRTKTASTLPTLLTGAMPKPPRKTRRVNSSKAQRTLS